MIYLDLILGFLRVGCFAFGGAYAAIPLIRDVVISYGWLTSEEMSYMIAVSESTPGPIMVNLATYVGSSQAGLLGAFLATTAVVLPAFLIVLIIMAAFKNAMENRWVKATLRGLKPAMIGIILATGADLMLRSLMLQGTWTPDWRALLIAAILLAALFISKKLLHKKLSTILLIVISAVCGIVIYGI